MPEPRLISPTRPTGPRPFDPTGPVAGKDPVYHGGPLLTNIHIQPVFWGNAWTQPAQSALPGQLAGFFQFLVTSSIMDMLAEYNASGQTIVHGSVLPNQLKPNPQGGFPGSIADTAIRTQIDNWVGSSALPSALDALYFIFLPPGVTSTKIFQGTLQTSCAPPPNGYCSYHGLTPGNNAYAVMPFTTCSGCAQATQLETFTVFATHEVCEAITDSNGGWWDSTPGGAGNEIGDFCGGSNLSITTLGGFTVQKIWSNEQNACAVAPGTSFSSPVVFGRGGNEATGGHKSIYVVRGAAPPVGQGTGTISQYWDTDVWNRDFPPHATAIGAYPNLQFVNSPAVLPRGGSDDTGGKKSIYAVTNSGRLVQMWDTGVWNIDFPAEAANGSFPPGFAKIRFQGTPAVFGREPSPATGGKKSIYVITTDGRLVQLWDTDVWNADFPAEKLNGNYQSLPGAAWNTRFVGSPAVLGIANQPDAEGGKKSIYAVNADGNLVQLWDTDVWNGDFPALDPGGRYAPGWNTRFTGTPAVFGREPSPATGGKKSIYIITADHRLAQLWDTDAWNGDFPAENADAAKLRFQGNPAVFARQNQPDAEGGKKSVYAITTDGRLAQLWDTATWHADFPAEAPGGNYREPWVPRFKFSPAVFGREIDPEAEGGKKSIYAINASGALVQLWDTAVWNGDFPLVAP